MPEQTPEQLAQDQRDMLELGYRRSAMERYVPHHLREGLGSFIAYGHPVGHFLTAVMKNDLFGALAHADETSAKHLKQICQFIYNDVNAACGRVSAESYYRWLNMGGHQGWKRLQAANAEFESLIKNRELLGLDSDDGLLQALRSDPREPALVEQLKKGLEPAAAARVVFDWRVRTHGQ